MAELWLTWSFLGYTDMFLETVMQIVSIIVEDGIVGVGVLWGWGTVAVG